MRAEVRRAVVATQSTLPRSVLPGERETSCQGKGTVTHSVVAPATKSGSTAGAADCPHGPLGMTASLSSASPTLQAQVRGKKVVLTGSFQPALPAPGEVSRVLPALELWAELPQQCKCIAQVHPFSPLPSPWCTTSGHFLPTLVCLQLGTSIP